jgi:hypothetical protein
MDVTCPYCGETVSVALDPGGGPEQRYVEDCPVCCRPMELLVRRLGDGELTVNAARADD